MKRKALIFDWKKSESRGRDKFFSVIIVGLLFALVFEMLELRLPERQEDSAEEGTLIRLVDAEMAKTWALVAEENGPFPGRLETGGELAGTIFSASAGLSAWTGFEVKLRPFQKESRVGHAQITPKGERVFPAIATGLSGVIPGETVVRKVPILIPYDSVALKWIPEKLPAFQMPAGAEVAPDSLRFAVSLRENGSVAEAIPLGGGADAAQTALERWLRGVRFGKATGERWFGLRVDFINRRNDGARPE